MKKDISSSNSFKKDFSRLFGMCSLAVVFILSCALPVAVARDLGYALSFDGQDDYADCGNGKSLNLTNTMTMETWIRPLDWNTESGISMVLDKGKFSLFLNWENDAVFNDHSLVFEFQLANGSTVQLNTLTDSIRLNVWQHVAVTYDGIADAVVYINGERQPVLYFSGIPSGPVADNSQDHFYIGNSADLASPFNGSIGEIRAWKVVRNWRKIQATMYIELENFETVLAGYWPVGEDKTALTDESGRGNTGTIFGAVLTEAHCETAGYPEVITSQVGPVSSANALITGQITDDGGVPITEKGACWNTSGTPMIEKNDKRTVITGTKTGVFTIVIEELMPETIYYVRVYATNCSGKTSYGSQKTFITPVKPRVRTIGAGSASYRTAMGAGYISDDGKGAISARGVCWSTWENPTLENSASYSADGEGVGDFISSITGLSPGTTYYVRAYATNGAGTSYGEEYSFKTLPMGDINGDRTVDLNDVILILKVLSGADLGDAINSDADLNGDNKLGIQEVVYILGKISGD